ncbi:uncharacterized protein BDZ99DRAFT_105304 [Mytilinidion resinicola]|uniref:Uncharacterized protein n=1 Tax=Mytilinidion resinicola TaxID=574789 RepID=A0A6A6YA42_9PEZI|nr:uncharacterized protein BDZ99DRAFT_105304 [Mytilinidion resinicola]KAF2805428.1 hypothetical protein BDZ99DRAFT_105304 [Mytilinidion resinicola]
MRVVYVTMAAHTDPLQVPFSRDTGDSNTQIVQVAELEVHSLFASLISPRLEEYPTRACSPGDSKADSSRGADTNTSRSARSTHLEATNTRTLHLSSLARSAISAWSRINSVSVMIWVASLGSFILVLNLVFLLVVLFAGPRGADGFRALTTIQLYSCLALVPGPAIHHQHIRHGSPRRFELLHAALERLYSERDRSGPPQRIVGGNWGFKHTKYTVHALGTNSAMAHPGSQQSANPSPMCHSLPLRQPHLHRGFYTDLGS